MDLYTKLFLINWIIILSIAACDSYLLDDAMGKLFIIGSVLMWWSLASILSVPAWLIWIILK